MLNFLSKKTQRQPWPWPTKDLSLLKSLLNYDPSTVSQKMSPSESMPGENYIWVGQSAAECIIAAIATSKLTKVNSVLDMPCGHGRVLRHLVALFPHAYIDACDLDKEGLSFCEEAFGARPIVSQEDLTKVDFGKKYDLIWIGSLFTHLSKDRTAEWLVHLSKYLTDAGIIVATFHGRWTERVNQRMPYTSPEMWAKIAAGYGADGYGYADYARENSHHFIEGSYGFSLSRADTIMNIATSIPGTRIFSYTEQGWGGNHDVLVLGRPDWDHWSDVEMRLSSRAASDKS